MALVFYAASGPHSGSVGKHPTKVRNTGVDMAVVPNVRQLMGFAFDVREVFHVCHESILLLNLAQIKSNAYLERIVVR